MADNIFYSLRNFGMRLINGFGKDQYTQTHFPSVLNYQFLMKGENWLSSKDEYKFILYNTIPHLKAVIDRKASMKANARYKHYRMVRGEKVEVENSDFVHVIENPNILQNGNEFAMQRAIQFDLYGNEIIYVKKVGNTPKTMWCLDSEYVSMDLTGMMFQQVDIEGIINEYIYRKYEKTEKFSPKDIIHIRVPNPKDPLRGLSKLEALMLVLSNIRGAMGFRNRIINSNAMLGILSTDVAGTNGMNPQILTTEEQSRINQGFESKWGMQEGKSNILQTEAAVKWQAMSYPTKDLMLFEEVDSDFECIIDAFGLNRNIFSFSKQSTFENMEHGVKICYRDTIIPEMEAEAIAFTKFFGMDGKNEWLEACFDHLDILKTDDTDSKDKISRAIATLIGAGVNSQVIQEITGINVGVVTPVSSVAANSQQ